MRASILKREILINKGGGNRVLGLAKRMDASARSWVRASSPGLASFGRRRGWAAAELNNWLCDGSQSHKAVNAKRRTEMPVTIRPVTLLICSLTRDGDCSDVGGS